jgi:hypothetical protein
MMAGIFVGYVPLKETARDTGGPSANHRCAQDIKRARAAVQPLARIEANEQAA